MKKTLTITAVVLMFGAMAAIAGTINIPQFNDGGGNVDAAFFPPSSSATWITVTNTTATDKVITINYYTLAGVANGTSTWMMGAYKAVSWRPVKQDPAEADAIPSPLTGTGAGWCQILFPGTASDVAGRVFVNAQASMTSYGFTLFAFD